MSITTDDLIETESRVMAYLLRQKIAEYEARGAEYGLDDLRDRLEDMESLTDKLKFIDDFLDRRKSRSPEGDLSPRGLRLSSCGTGSAGPPAADCVVSQHPVSEEGH